MNCRAASGPRTWTHRAGACTTRWITVSDAPTSRSRAMVTTAAFAFLQGRFRGERPGVAGVTQEQLPGPKTAGFRMGRSLTSPLYPFAAREGGVLGRDLVDMEGLSRYRDVSGSVTRGVS